MPLIVLGVSILLLLLLIARLKLNAFKPVLLDSGTGDAIKQLLVAACFHRF